MPKSMSSVSKSNSRSSRRRVRRRDQLSLVRQLSRYTIVFERCARLSVNGLLSVVSLIALSRLVPHLQTQTAQLATINQAVDLAEVSTSKLKSDFGRYFDPWQTEKIIQEQSGYRSPSERQVVWTEPELSVPGESQADNEIDGSP